MAFRTPSQTSEATGPKNLELKKKTLLREIEVLGNQHFVTNLACEKIEKELKEIKERKAKVEDVKTELNKLEKKKIELELNHSNLETEIKEKEKKLLGLNKQHNKKVAVLDLEFLAKKEEVESEISGIRKEIDSISKELSILTSKKDQFEKEKDILTKAVNELKSEAEALKGDFVKLNKINKELVQSKKNKKELEGSITRLESLEVSLKKRVNNLHKEMLKIKNEVLKVAQAAGKFINKKKAVKQEFEDEMKKRIEEADERDGLLSEREAWLKSKTDDLRNIKAELEKFHNKPLKHIII